VTTLSHSPGIRRANLALSNCVKQPRDRLQHIMHLHI